MVDNQDYTKGIQYAIDTVELVKEARKRYETDPEFHAIVYKAVQLHAFAVKIESGVEMGEELRNVVCTTAAICLFLKEEHDV